MSNLDAFSTTTATRLAPDRAERWLTFFDVFSSTIPEEVPDAEYSDLVLGAWLDFRELDHGAQVAAISRAWNIRHPQKVTRKVKAQPPAVIDQPAVKPWEPCPFWRVPKEPCTIHKHAMRETDTAYKQAQSLFEIHARFVRKHILVELQPWSDGKRYDVKEIESAVWWNVAQRMPEYLPLMETKPDKGIGKYVTDSTKTDQARAQMWLRAIVHTTAIDVVRGNHLKEGRNLDREVPIPVYAGNTGIPNPCDPTPAKPTPTASDRNRMRAHDAEQWDAAHGV